MGRTSGDDAYQPFSMGGYTVTEERGTLTISYAVNRPVESMGVTAGSGTTISLPVIDSRTPHCGLAAGSGPEPAPLPTHPSS